MNRLLWAAVIALAGGLVVALVAGRARPVEQTPLWLAIPPPPYGFDDHPEPAVSRDGTQVAFVAPGPDHPRMLWIRSLQSQTSRLLPGTQDATLPYMNSFPALDNEIPLSQSGGILPRWSRGKEVVYMSADRRTLLAVEVSGSKPGTPHILFELPKLSTDASVARTRIPYAVTEDGQRFLMLVAVDEPVPPSLIVGFNWQESPSN
jgi:hypothetical protein